MRLTGNVGSDLATIVLFDPTAIESILRAKKPDPDQWDIATDERRMAMYLPGGDGGFEFAIFINEQPPQATLDSAQNHAEGYLHVPSGVLCISGAESLHQPEAETLHLKSLHPDTGEQFEIAPGWYHVRAFDADVDDSLFRKELLAKLSPEQQELLNAGQGSCVLGCTAIALGVVALIVALILPAFITGFRFWWVLGGVVTVWLLMYLAIVFNPRQRAINKAATRYMELRKQHEGEYPDLVFVLTSIEADKVPGEATGCRLGRD